LWNEKIPWISKVLNGTISANKEPLFIKVFIFKYFSFKLMTGD